MKRRRLSSSWSLRLGCVVGVVTATTAGLWTWQEARQQQAVAVEDLTRRAGLLAHRLTGAARRAISLGDVAALEDRLDGHGRLLGMAVFAGDGTALGVGPALTEIEPLLRALAFEAMGLAGDRAQLGTEADSSMHVLARPIQAADGAVVGAVVAAHDGRFVRERYVASLRRGAGWSAGAGVLTALMAFSAAWLLFERPMHRLAEWMRRLRVGNTPERPPARLPLRRLADESARLAATYRAARSRDAAAASEVVRSDRVWTRERLRAHALSALRDRPLVVVSNREPYLHVREGTDIRVLRPASGLVTALDPVLRACGGLWVAHGAGDADRQASDAGGCVTVPPEDPRYSLRRVWLSKEEEEGYYYGYANEGLWPLCHLTHERPVFRAGDWEHYRAVNDRFAQAVVEEIGTGPAVVLVQDYQLALVPGLIRARRPDWLVGLFWHIPWPTAEAFRICPHGRELVAGMLGADLIGFHLQQHCNNFLQTVDSTVEARLDWDRFSAQARGRTSLVRPHPISVQPWAERGVPSAAALREQMSSLRQGLGLGRAGEGPRLGVGVDRIDYTKGIAERFRAFDRLFELHPSLKGTFTFVQLGAPSRTHIPRYRALVTELETLADAINWKHRHDQWRPIAFLVDHHDASTVHAFLRMSDVAVVSSLHDGMNLVAKEFVAAQAEATGEPGDTGEGVLVLSEFAGAARDLPEALVINPYDTEAFAAALHQALTMEARERRQRMTRLRVRVEEHNIYRWAAEFIGTLTSATQPADGPADAARPVDAARG